MPDISNAEAVKRAVLEADSLVFNRASTGHYFEALLNKMGLHAQALPKSTRYPDGASVMDTCGTARAARSAPMKAPPSDEAQALLRHLASASMRAAFAAAGIDQAP